MPTVAPDTKSLRNFKGNFRAAVASILDAAGWTNVALERETKTLARYARKEISFNLGQAKNQETLDSGTKVYDFFDAILTIRIVTARREGDPAAAPAIIALHDRFVAEALDIFAEEKSPFTEALLPYYSVTTILPKGTASDLDVVYFEDFTDITLALEFGIRRTAWPAGT